MEEYKLSVASSPHASSPVGTKNLMRDVLIALIPALAMGIYVFGPRALTTTLVSVIFCEIFEWGYCKLMHKPIPLQGPVCRHHRRAAGVCMSGNAALLDDHYW